MLINWEAAVLLGQQDGRLPEFEGRILEKGHLIGGRTIGKMGVDLLTHSPRGSVLRGNASRPIFRPHDRTEHPA